ncbi:MAG: hypothetical protein G01um101493_21 [Microgenomates group bacterium Gr01-1014_93]|nr:MAG: hypothetical protein G01um101493_21 [Microgenomates group bacterium Gr01-1014_93]
MAIEAKQIPLDLGEIYSGEPIRFANGKSKFVVTDNYFSAGFETEEDAWRYFMRTRISKPDLVVLPVGYKLPLNHNTATYPTEDGNGLVFYRRSDQSEVVVRQLRLPEEK